MRVGRVVAVFVLVVSVAASGGVGVLWRRSHWKGDYFQFDLHRVGVGWDSVGGGVRMSVATATPPQRMDAAAGRWSWAPSGGDAYPDPNGQFKARLQWLGVGLDSDRNHLGGRWFGLVVPYWMVMGVALVPAALATKRLLRRRTRPGICARCGYDLRASPGRCPECGADPVASTAPIP